MTNANFAPFCDCVTFSTHFIVIDYHYHSHFMLYIAVCANAFASTQPHRPKSARASIEPRGDRRRDKEQRPAFHGPRRRS